MVFMSCTGRLHLANHDSMERWTYEDRHAVKDTKHMKRISMVSQGCNELSFLLSPFPSPRSLPSLSCLHRHISDNPR